MENRLNYLLTYFIVGFSGVFGVGKGIEVN